MVSLWILASQHLNIAYSYYCCQQWSCVTSVCGTGFCFFSAVCSASCFLSALNKNIKCRKSLFAKLCCRVIRIFTTSPSSEKGLRLVLYKLLRNSVSSMHNPQNGVSECYHGYYFCRLLYHVPRSKITDFELCQSCQERNLMMFLKEGKFVIFIVSNLFTHCCPIDRILEGMKYHAKIRIEIFQGGVALVHFNNLCFQKHR
jgi:hypothetical protein